MKQILLWFVLIIAAYLGENAMASLDQIQKITEGKGVFTVIVHNDGSHDEWVSVRTSLLNPPVGYEHMASAVYYAVRVQVKAHSATTVLMPVPFVTKYAQYEDIADYIGRGPELPSNSQVVISVLKRSLEFGHPEVIIPARYVPNTRLIELPREVPLRVNYDDPSLLHRHLVEPRNPEELTVMNPSIDFFSTKR